MKKILITGGAGFIGSHLSEYLSKKNQVIVIDNLMHGNKITNFKNIKFINGDAKDYDLMKYHSKDCSIIFHLAAIIGVDIVASRNLDTMESEFLNIRNVCKVAKINDVKKIIYSSSSGVYGKLNYKLNVKENDLIAPESGYAVAKRSAEIYLKNFYNDFKIPCIAVRLFNVYGPRQDTRMVVSRFIQNAIVNKPIYIYGDGKQTRDFTYIDDCVKVFDLIAKKANKFHILNSSWGKDHSIIFLANTIVKILKSKSKIIKIKVPKKLQEFQVQKRCADSSLLKKIIGYKPAIDFETGLKKTILNIVKTT